MSEIDCPVVVALRIFPGRGRPSTLLNPITKHYVGLDSNTIKIVVGGPHDYYMLLVGSS